ncbi:hypothetical protein BH11ARM1_BH11ARM1_06330 [soil metagenome]
MLVVCFGGFSEATADQTFGNLMSPRDQIIHLIACSRATEDFCNGKEVDWNSYGVDDTDWDSLLSQFSAQRAKAVSAIDPAKEDAYMHIYGFLAAHDSYHAGQLVALRLSLDPEWNSYEIYG